MTRYRPDSSSSELRDEGGARRRPGKVPSRECSSALCSPDRTFGNSRRRLTAPLIERIRADLSEFGLSFEEGPDPSIIRFDAGGEGASWSCFVWVREAESQVIVHSVMPWAVPEAARVPVALYLTRANYGLLIGNFELDLNDGELRFKTSVDYSGSEGNPEMVRRLIATNLRAVERYIPGVVQVVDGTDPHAAIEVAESAD